MDRYYEIADVCPGCGIPLLAGAIASAIESARQYVRIFGLMPGVEPHACDAIYLGCVIRKGETRCPRCGADPVIERAPPSPPPTRGDDRDFLEELTVDLELSIRARNLINRAGARTVAELLALSPDDLRRVARGDAESHIKEIREFLARRCLSLREEA